MSRKTLKFTPHHSESLTSQKNYFYVTPGLLIKSWWFLNWTRNALLIYNLKFHYNFHRKLPMFPIINKLLSVTTFTT
jgi:hypothetical protein